MVWFNYDVVTLSLLLRFYISVRFIHFKAIYGSLPISIPCLGSLCLCNHSIPRWTTAKGQTPVAFTYLRRPNICIEIADKLCLKAVLVRMAVPKYFFTPVSVPFSPVACGAVFTGKFLCITKPHLSIFSALSLYRQISENKLLRGGLPRMFRGFRQPFVFLLQAGCAILSAFIGGELHAE